MPLDDRFGDGKAQATAGAFRRACRVDFVKPFEDVRKMLRCDAAAVSLTDKVAMPSACLTQRDRYTCDRGNARVQVFDRTGVRQRIISIGSLLDLFNVRLMPLSFASKPVATPFSTMNVTVVVEALLPSA